eukprot:7381314-Prymnesium_polylepis.1
MRFGMDPNHGARAFWIGLRWLGVIPARAGWARHLHTFPTTSLRQTQRSNLLSYTLCWKMRFTASQPHFPRLLIGNRAKRLISWEMAPIPALIFQTLVSKTKGFHCSSGLAASTHATSTVDCGPGTVSERFHTG